MIDTFQIFEELKETFESYQAERLVKIFSRIYNELANTVTKEEFKELTEVVKVLSERVDRLAISQEKFEISLENFKKTTEENFNRVWESINELAEAQKKTEQRLNELAEAQKKTEQRLNELAEAQKRTEQRLNELAEAQKKTEEKLSRFIDDHRETRRHLGTLTHTVGYVLEDRAYRGLPQLLKRDFGIEVMDTLKRDYIETGIEKYEEVNIIGRGRKDGKEFWIVGDCKSQLKKSDVDEFLKLVKRIENFLKGDKLLIAVTYNTSPVVKRYSEEKGVKVYFSYEMPL